MKCYMEGQCKKFKNGSCDFDRCGIQLLTASAYNHSNIPKRYRKDIPIAPETVDMGAAKQLVEFRDNIMEHVENGDGLYIYSSNCGNGKTTWSTKIARKYIVENAFKQKHENLVYFINVADYLEELRQSFNDKDVSTKDIDEKLKSCDLLILDDLGVEKASDWVIERLYSLINYRVDEEKSMIITSNLTVEEIKTRLNARIASRIYGSCEIVNLVGEDRR